MSGSWTTDAKRDAAIRGPIGGDVLMADTRVVSRPGWFQLVTPSTKSTILNEVVLSEVAVEDADRVIEEVIATYRAHGLPVKWCVGPWTKPDDFGARLDRRGFRSWDVRGMVCDAGLSLESPEDVEIAPVREENLDSYVDAFITGWSLGEAQRENVRDQHLRAMTRTPQIGHFFLALIDGEPVATTGVLLREDFGYMVGAQVLPRFRKRGVYRSLIVARLDFLRGRGKSLAVTHAREATSAPMLAHLGFETVFRSKCYVLDP